MRSKLTIIFFAAIFLFATFLRLYQLGSVPISPDWDEAALGYNAYSILLTGKDEYGETFPIVLRSFDDYKPALYAYLIIPFLFIFDLSIIAVRLPAVIFGLTAVATVFFLLRNLFQNGIELGKIKLDRDTLSLLSMFLFAIAPWHIQFSRVAFEAQVGLSMNLLSILFFLKALRNKFFLPLSFIFAALSIYVYQSEKVYIPLLFILLIACFWKEFIKIQKKWIVISFTVGFLVVLPMLIYILVNPAALTRARGVSVFTDTTKLLSSNTQKIDRDRLHGNYIGLILDNRRVEYGKAFISGYLSHFEPNWLFYRGDALRHQPPYMGLLYFFELPFILIGLYVLLFSKVARRIKIFIAAYVLIAPIPASITIDVPHAVRAINMLPAPQLLAAVGLLYTLKKVSDIKYQVLSIKLKYLVFTAIFFLFSINFLYYLNQYFVQMNYYYSKAWQYGWEEAVSYAVEKSKDFDRVVVTNVAPLDQSYMFFLYYMKYDPVKYLAEGGTKSGGFDENHTAFEKFEFRPIDWEKDRFLTNTLFVGRSEDLPDNRGKVIHYLDGEPAIVFSEKHE